MKSLTVVIVLLAQSITLLAQETHQFLSTLSDRFHQAAFIENKGQWPDDVLFAAKLESSDVWILKSGLKYSIQNIESGRDLATTSVRGHVIEMELVEANSSIEVTTRNIKPTHHNYFFGNDSSRWARHVRLYEEVQLDNVYDGVGVRYYFDQGSVRYDFILQPGASVEQLRMRFHGQDSLSTSSKGELVLATSMGLVKHKQLFAFQEVDGVQEEVQCDFLMGENGEVGLEVGEYDASRPLVIDPIIWSTVLGGIGSDYVAEFVVNEFSEITVLGYEAGLRFPILNGPFGDLGSSGYNVVLAKLSPGGSKLLYSTFIGGGDDDYGRGIELDSSGDIYIAGSTESDDFPITPGAFDENHNGGSDVFVLKMSKDGDAIKNVTFIGGTSDDDVARTGIVLDNSGNVYLTGITESSDFPTTFGCYESRHSGREDVFVSRISSDFTSLTHSTYVGGEDQDFATDIELTSIDEVVVVGYTESEDFRTTPGAYDRVFEGDNEIFAFKINATLDNMRFATFIGGELDESARSVQVDANDNVCVVGSSASSDFPVSPDAFQKVYRGGTIWGNRGDGVITMLAADGKSLLFSTYLGGDNYDAISDVILDSENTVYVTGTTRSQSFPTTDEEYSMNRGSSDAFFCIISKEGRQMRYGALIAGNDTDIGRQVARAGNGQYLIAGTTTSSDFPTTPGTFDDSQNGFRTDLFFTMLQHGPTSVATDESLVTSISVFPNPPEGQLRFYLSGLDFGVVRVQLVSLDGSIVIDAERLFSSESIALTVDASTKSTLATGMYQLLVTDEGGNTTNTTVHVK